MSPLKIFWLNSAICTSIVGGLSLVWPATLGAFVVSGSLILLGIYDSFRRSYAVSPDLPVIVRARYWMEAIRPEIQQYFAESGTPPSIRRRMNHDERGSV